jgi:hypothetical protein
MIPALLFAAATVAANPSSVASAPALVSQYCSGCHNDRLKSGDLSLAHFDAANPVPSAPIAEKVIRKVRAGMMPPPGAPRPPAATLSGFVSSLENALDRSAALNPNPGAPALHRLNRTEYANSIRDLLDLRIDAAKFLPADDLSHGFDNMADVLTVSPTLMEAYVRAAGKISRQAVGDVTVKQQTINYTLPRVISQTRHVEGTPFGTRGGIAVVHDFPADGKYSFRLTFYYHQMGTTLFGQTLGKGQQIEVSVDGERVALFDINPLMKQTEDLRTPFIPIHAGPRKVAAAFIQNFEGAVEDEVSPPEQSLVDVNVANIPGLTTLPHLHDLSIVGPQDVTGVSETPSRRKVFTCHPAPGADEIPCAKKILSGLTRQAWRRPVTDADLEKLLSYYQAGRNQGDFESGIRTALQAIIANPEFVFRFERTPAGVAPGRNYKISGLELASRLSYFLWSSAPDSELIALAAAGKLSDDAVLEKQTRRMLADPRAESLATNFAGQWLNLQNLKDALPDPLMFPNFDRNLALSMRRETELLFDSVVHEDRNILDLLTANYTFVDERLAKHYGIPNVMGSRFRRVEVADENRRGLLGEAGILTLTSVANRTSPVQRGKWVMNVLLGVPPPTPPPNVPALKEAAENTRPQSVRERLEEHRKNPACASCHKLMDPIGFALENFDAVGVWRTNDGEFRVDSAGQMYDGAKLDGPASLRRAILNHSDSFILNFTENLLAYGLGRVPDYYDMPVVRSIDREAARNGNRFSSFVLGVVKSAPFQMRRAEAEFVSQTGANRNVHN